MLFSNVCHLICYIHMVIDCFPCTDSISSFCTPKLSAKIITITNIVLSYLLYFFIFSVIQPVLLVMAGILSMEIASSLEPVLLQSRLTDHTFHPHLSMDIIQKLLPNCQMSLITLQEVSGHEASHSCHPGLQPKCSRRQVGVTTNHNQIFP